MKNLKRKLFSWGAQLQVDIFHKIQFITRFFCYNLQLNILLESKKLFSSLHNKNHNRPTRMLLTKCNAYPGCRHIVMATVLSWEHMMIEYTIEQVESYPVICVNCTSSTDQKEISKYIKQAYSTLSQHLQSTGSFPIGPALTIYNKFEDEGTNFDVCFPVMVDAHQTVKDNIKASQTPSGLVVKAVHKGSYNSLYRTYMMLYKAIENEGLKHGDQAWEVYLDSRGQTSEEEMLTQIFISVN